VCPEKCARLQSVSVCTPRVARADEAAANEGVECVLRNGKKKGEWSVS
jgi:hypothetical protein